MVFRTELHRIEGGGYSIIANRDGSKKRRDEYDAGYGGFECMRIEAIKIDNHYVLNRINTPQDFFCEPFGVVDIDRPDELEKRLYKEAKKEGREERDLIKIFL